MKAPFLIMKTPLWTVISLAGIIFPVLHLSAQFDDISFERIEGNQFEEDPAIYYLYQDARGFMWLSDYRYDGEQVHYYPSFTAPSKIHGMRVGAMLANTDLEEVDSLFYYNATADSFLLNFPKNLPYVYNDLLAALTSKHCCHCYFQDSDRNIWMGSLTDGILVYEPASKSFQNFKHRPEVSGSLSSSQISTLLKDRKNRIWIGTWDAGLNLWTGDSTFQVFRYQKDDPDGLPSDTIAFMKEDEQGIIWIGTPQGLGRLDPESKTITTVHFPEPMYNHVKKIFIDSRGNLWLGTQLSSNKNDFENQSIVLYDPVAKRVKKHFENLAIYWNNLIFSIEEDHLGRIWLGSTNNGIYVYDPGTEQMKQFLKDPRDPKSLSSSFIRQIFRDKEDRIWIGTFNGVSIYDPNAKLFHHREMDDLGRFYFNSENKYDGLEDEEGNIWLASRGAGLIKVNSESRRIQVFRTDGKDSGSKGGNDIVRMLKDRKGDIWLTGDAVGVSVLDPDTGEMTHLASPAGVADLTEDEAGNIWVGGIEGFLIYSSKSEPPEFRSWQSILNDPQNAALHLHDSPYPWSMATDCNGDIWISGDFFLIKYNPRTNLLVEMVPGDEPSSLPYDTWIEISLDSHCNLWFGTKYYGLAKLPLAEQKSDSPKFQRWYRGNSTIPSNTVYEVMEDGQDRIWFGTPLGAVRLDPVSNAFYTYGKREGLETDATKLVPAKDGTIYVGGINGVGYFHPDRLATNVHQPPVYLTDILVNQHSLVHSDSLPFESPLQESIFATNFIRLKHWQDELTFKFVALNYTDPQHNQYQYQLVGYDEDWKKTSGSGPMATYTNLDHGSYIFRVIGYNNDGVQSDEEFSLNILIVPPWWQTWLAQISFLFLVLAAIYVVYRYHLRRQLAIAEARRLKDLDQIKNRLYTNITHEFRTPLTVILGLTDQITETLSQKTSIARKAKDHLKLIRRNGQRLLYLINQLLDLARLDSGSMPVKKIQADVVPFMLYLAESFQALAQVKNIRLAIHSDVETLIMDFDPDKLEQIIVNLLSNAIKFTPEDGKVSLLLMEKNVSGSPHLCIKVQDTGQGISETQVGKIFDRFYQIDGSASRPGEGTGIGLALTKELAVLLGGDIRVESKMGKGTIFFVQLPISREAMPEQPEHDPNSTGELFVPAVPERTGKPLPLKAPLPTVLLIEDNPDVVVYIKTCLEQEYQVDTARDGQIGIEKAREKVPDLIICDVMMPEKNGYEVCDVLKKDERTNHIPIVMLTAKATHQDKLKGLQAGADAFLKKPFDRTELLVRLEKMLALRRVLQMRYAVMKTPETVASSSVRQQDAFVLKMYQVVEAGLNDPAFGIIHLQRAANLSHMQVYRKLKALTGQTPSQFIRSIRLQKGMELLKTTSMTVSEVSYSVGFSDPSYFSSTFLEEFGQRPSVIRK